MSVLLSCFVFSLKSNRRDARVLPPCRIHESIAEQGWEVFRGLECDCLKSLLREYPRKTIISCGGGIVESASAQAVLKVRLLSFAGDCH